jgi:hypothetical protein
MSLVTPRAVAIAVVEPERRLLRPPVFNTFVVDDGPGPVAE